MKITLTLRVEGTGTRCANIKLRVKISKIEFRLTLEIT